MCAIDLATFRQSEAQLRPKWPQIEKVTPSASFAPSSSAGGVTLKVILAQLQRMDARLDTFSDELRQVNTHVGRIAWWQACLGGFVESPCHSLKAFEDEDDDGDSDDNDDDKGEDDSSSDDDMMIAWLTYPLSFVTKRGSSFWDENSHVFRGRVSIEYFFW